MVVVVPALAHRDQAVPGEGLHTGVGHAPEAGAGVVRQVGHHPVSRDADGHANEYAPDEPGPAAECEEQGGEGHLLQHPRAFEPLIPRVDADLGLDDERRRPVEFEAAGQLPERVEPQRLSMGKEVVTPRLALRPVAEVVDLQNADRAGHADDDAEIDQHMLQPFRAIEAPVDQPAVHADRVAEQQGHVGQCGEDQHRRHVRGAGRTGQRDEQQRAVPERLCGRPDNAARRGVSVVRQNAKNRGTHGGR
jgi:hypothetical protein